MNLTLERLEIGLYPAFLEYMKELDAHGESLGSLYSPTESETPEQFITRLRGRETNPEAPLVPETTYWAVVDGNVVGRISLRHRIKGNLTKIGGHIGYEVRPSFRNRGYAKEMLRQVLETPKAREIGNLLLTCSPDNVASNKTILANGGRLTGKVFVELVQAERNHYWIHTGVPRFETERLLLKEISLKDAESYQKNFAHWDIIRYLAKHVPWPYPENGAQEFIRNVILPQQGKERWWWGVFLKDQPDELIGVVEFYRDTVPDNRGFWLAKKHWGQGLMAEAVKPLTDYAFTQLGFEKLVLSNALGNMQSRRIKEKAGAKFLGIKSGKFVDPTHTELELWEMTRENWLQEQTT